MLLPELHTDLDMNDILSLLAEQTMELMKIHLLEMGLQRRYLQQRRNVVQPLHNSRVPLKHPSLKRKRKNR